MSENYIAEGFTSVTPYLSIKGADKAIEFYKEAFGAVERQRMLMPGTDIVMHAEIQIGNAIIMLAEDQAECPMMSSPTTLNGTTTGMMIYVEDAEKAFEQAKKAGATELSPVQEMFWGDRMGHLRDPFGHGWSIATHMKEVSPEEMKAGAKAWMDEMMAKQTANASC